MALLQTEGYAAFAPSLPRTCAKVVPHGKSSLPEVSICFVTLQLKPSIRANARFFN
jgi:hypothetical protein